MAKKKLKPATEEELFELAAQRVELPSGKLRLNYQPDADLLLIDLQSPRPSVTRSKSEPEAGVIFHYHGRALVSIEVLDLYGVFAQ
jgi:hypothetical protein